MAQKPVIWLPDVLRGGGDKVKTYSGWQTRGRPASSGSFNPFAILVHHTGTPTSLARPAPTVSFCITPTSGPLKGFGPLCQLVLGFDGLYHVIAAGRANHAGTARATGPMPAGDGNTMYIGIEVDYSGSQDMGAKQYAALISGCASILRKLGKDATFVRGHKETSSAGKWDPGRRGSSSPQYLMGDIRADVARALKATTKPPAPAGPQTEWRLVVGGRIKHRERHTPGMRPTAYENMVKFLGTRAGEKLVKDGADAKPPQKSCLVRVRA